MPFDGVVVRSLSIELNRVLTGAKINKISQPDKYDLLLELNNNRTNYRLLLSANPSLPRIYLTDEKKENPKTAPSFCMLLRKHLRGSYINKIYTLPYERIIFIEIHVNTALGEKTQRTLIIEIMGKHSNIILVDEKEKIIDSIKHIDNTTSRLREIMPARKYVLPPSQEKETIEMIRPETFFLRYYDSQQSVKNYIVSKILGFSNRTVLELCGEDIEPEKDIKSLDNIDISALILNLSKLKTMLRANIYSPCLIYSESQKTNLKDFYCLVLNEDGSRKYNKSMSYILDTYYRKKTQKEFILNRSSNLIKTIHNNIIRLRKKEKIHKDNISASEKAPLYRLYGELITSNIYKLKNNDIEDTIELENYYSGKYEKLKIPINISKSYQKNAEAYFKKATKLETAKIHSQSELKKIGSETEYLKTTLFHLETAENLEDIEDIKNELQSGGYVSKALSTPMKRGPDKKAIIPFHYISSEGFNIYVGKNNLQNDYLTLKAAASKDMWLHIKDYPGSHVIIRYEGKDFTQQVILEACILAAYHSKASSSQNIDVDHTYIKNVKRHSNKKLGMVYYTNYKTKNVTPDQKYIDTHLRKEKP